MPMCTAITVKRGFKIRERFANNSNNANESLPPDKPTNILSPSSIRRYFTIPLLKRCSTRRIILSSSVNCAISVFRNRAQKYMKRMIYGRFHKIE